MNGMPCAFFSYVFHPTCDFAQEAFYYHSLFGYVIKLEENPPIGNTGTALHIITANDDDDDDEDDDKDDDEDEDSLQRLYRQNFYQSSYTERWINRYVVPHSPDIANNAAFSGCAYSRGALDDTAWLPIS
jgi:hypothetical protein